MNSRIYSKEGGYRAYYSIKGEKSQIYPEITAYAISLACILFNREKRISFLERAEKCAEYLMKIGVNGSLPSYNYTPHYRSNIRFSFDAGIFASSMFDLYSITKKDVYLNTAKKSLKWLENQYDGRKFAPTNDPKYEKNRPFFTHVQLTKLAIPLLKAWIYLKEEKYKEMATNLLEWSKTLQLEDGRFVITDGENSTMTHYHCYATEGFLYAYFVLREKKYLEIALRAIGWLSKIQGKDGSFFAWYPSPPRKNKLYIKRKVTDATAQATRFWKILGINLEGINKAYSYLEQQVIDGGLTLSRLYRLPFLKPNRVYSWPTMFYIHSLLIDYGCFETTSELF
jgi:uncharacterized protein YyaL (SSP411 family)